MAILKIELYPSAILRNNNLPVSKVDSEIKTLIKDMLETMYNANGIGLAAPQIGKNIRLIVIDVSEERNQPMVLINPVIVNKENKIKSEEGCLSIPDYRDTIFRSELVVVQAKDQDFNNFEIEATGLLARCLQHEIDHLNGILFIDHLSRLKKRIFNQWFISSNLNPE